MITRGGRCLYLMHTYSIFFSVAVAVVTAAVMVVVVGGGLLLYIIYCYCWFGGLDPFYFNGVKYMLHGVLKKIDTLLKMYHCLFFELIIVSVS